MIGARKNIDEKGFDVAGLRKSRICVRAHRKPEKKAAVMIRKNPRAEKVISPKTMRMTPTVIVAMMATRRHDGVSRRKRNANMRTKAREEDLHIAANLRLGTLCLFHIAHLDSEVRVLL